MKDMSWAITVSIRVCQRVVKLGVQQTVDNISYCFVIVVVISTLLMCDPEQSFPAHVFGKQEPNWHLFTENKEYIATIKNPESPHGRITYSGPQGKRDKHWVSVLNVESHRSDEVF